MPRTTLTGTRIRERRMLAGVKQAELARTLGVSPAYLNLIEHNRRRVSPVLIEAAAVALGTDATALAEGAQAAVFDGLREAAAGTAGGPQPAETDRIEEFVGRYPGWAELLASRQTRIRALERTVEVLTDRMAHDPHLSASLHAVLSAAASVRSTAAILAEGEDIAPEWRDRFHRNLDVDSERLAEAAAALVAYLDASQDADAVLSSPQEELEAWLGGRDYHVAELEAEPSPDTDSLISGAAELASKAARALAAAYLGRYADDAARLPLPRLAEGIAEAGPDPLALATREGQSLPVVFRRIAFAGGREGIPAAGLVVADGSGSIVFRRPVAGFPFPRFGGACPLWPLYDALARPMQPVRAEIETAGLVPRRFAAYAFAEPHYPAGFSAPPAIEASMLLMPLAGPRTGGERPVGTSCRVCPRPDCAHRREPSITAGT